MFENSVSWISRLIDVIWRLMHDYSEASEIVRKIYQINWIASDELSLWIKQLWCLEIIH